MDDRIKVLGNKINSKYDEIFNEKSLNDTQKLMLFIKELSIIESNFWLGNISTQNDILVDKIARAIHP